MNNKELKNGAKMLLAAVNPLVDIGGDTIDLK